jgi:RNA polymerase sigma-70 factor (ECF subfamily)
MPGLTEQRGTDSLLAAWQQPLRPATAALGVPDEPERRWWRRAVQDPRRYARFRTMVGLAADEARLERFGRQTREWGAATYSLAEEEKPAARAILRIQARAGQLLAVAEIAQAVDAVAESQSAARRQYRTPMDADAQVMVRVQRGEPEAFERLVRRYGGPLQAFFTRLGGGAADAEDLVQETFLRVFKARETFDAQRPLTPWIYGIAAHVWADHGRRQGAAPAALALEEPEAAPDDVADQAARRDLAQRVREAVQQLPEEHRLVLILRHYHGLSYADIGQALGISVGTVKSRMHYALAKLRSGMQRRGLLGA